MIAPPHASDGFKTDSAPFSPHAFFLLVQPNHVDFDVLNVSLYAFFCLVLAACQEGKYSSFSRSCKQRFGDGGATFVDSLIMGYFLVLAVIVSDFWDVRSHI